VTPPGDENSETLAQIKQITSAIAKALVVSGPFNMQLIAKENKLKVIECNLRVSRSFPFVSKTLGHDFIATATQIIIGQRVEPIDVMFGEGKVGVKVPVFSFSRLSGADIKLGVEMSSTGEVACFGEDRYEAYLKAMIGTGFTMPKKTILLSVGSYKHKVEMMASVEALHEMGYKLYGSSGTSDYYREHGVPVETVEWLFESIGDETDIDKMAGQMVSMADYLSNKHFDLVINLPMRNTGARRVSSFVPTYGYKTRRMAVDYGVPLITDVKCAKLLVEAIQKTKGKLTCKFVDCITAKKIVRLPGLIDTHVHMREPGATHKEDFSSGTAAALAGGVTMVCAMPNTIPPVTDETVFNLCKKLASEKAYCDYALMVGATSTNYACIPKLASQASGLKMYLNRTFTDLMMESTTDWLHHFQHWPRNAPICVHAEGTTVAAVILMASLYDRPLHICHVSSKDEIEIVKAAKMKGLPITCEVCPHHLFLTEQEIHELGDNMSDVRPRVGRQEDQEALWENMDYIDSIVTDHAPHTLEEKKSSVDSPGFSGLETMLPLLLTAVNEGKITLQELEEKMYHSPRRIFGLPEQPDTYIEIDMDHEWTIPDKLTHSKAGWTPFAGRKVKGIVRRVILRGEVAFVDGKVLVEPGYGQDVKTWSSTNQVQFKTLPAVKKSSLMDAEIAPNRIRAEGERHESDITCERQRKESGHQGIRPTSPIFDGLEHPHYEPYKRHHGSPTKTDRSDKAEPEMLPSNFLIPIGLPIQESSLSLAGKHIIKAGMFKKEQLNAIFDLAFTFHTCVVNERPIDHILKGKVMASVFYEVSTRTACSFSAAMQRLGGKVIYSDETSSSSKKGETIEDSVQVKTR